MTEEEKKMEIEDNWQIDKIPHWYKRKIWKIDGKMRENALKQHSHLQMQTLVSFSLGVSIYTSPMVERASRLVKSTKVVISPDPREKKKR